MATKLPTSSNSSFHQIAYLANSIPCPYKCSIGFVALGTPLVALKYVCGGGSTKGGDYKYHNVKSGGVSLPVFSTHQGPSEWINAPLPKKNNRL